MWMNNCSGSRRAIITRIESVEQEYNEACMGVICKKFYKLILFLRSSDLHRLRSDSCKVEMDIKSIDHRFWSNPMLQISKLVLYTLAYLIWCPYIDWCKGWHGRSSIQINLARGSIVVVGHYFWNKLYNKSPKSKEEYLNEPGHKTKAPATASYPLVCAFLINYYT